MGFTHIDENGNAVMVDVSDKNITRRKAAAVGHIRMNEECFNAVQSGQVGKGNVLAVAQVAGIMATKQTASLIPLCHNLNLTKSKVEFILKPERQEIQVVCTVHCEGRTGVEMEALTGASVALLTVYDMCKAIDKRMEIGGVHLETKSGGRSGDFHFKQEGGYHD